MMTSLLAQKTNDTTQEDLRQLMEEVRRIPRLTPEQERELGRRCAEGDEDAIRQMVSANMGLVIAIARRYYNGNVPLQDLIQEGSIGLMTAAKKYDYSLNYRFSTYASKWIRQRVLRCAVEHENPVRIPVHTADKIHKVTKIQKALRLELEREPTTEELAERCQLSVEKTEELLRLQPQVLSLDAPLGEADSVGDLVEDVRSPQPQQLLAHRELLEIVDRLLAMLPERQKQILRLYFGMADGTCHSFEEIGQMLGISKERARQIKQQAMRRLKQLGTDIGLEEFLE